MDMIGIGNNKGGTGKTTTTGNLAHILASLYNKNVLVVDFDPQGQCSTSLGCTPHPGVYSLLTMSLDRASKEYITRYLQMARPNLSSSSRR